MTYVVRHLALSSLLLLWMAFAPGYAQTPSLRFEHLSVRDGIPGSEVHSIARDRQGFVWVGTRRCPARYDGSTFRSFLFPETYLIRGLAADSANRMWITSDRQGLCRIDPHTLRLTPVPNTGRATGYLYLDTRGQGWFSTLTGIGQIDLRTDSVRYYPLRQTTFQGLKAHDFLEDRQHTLWAVGSDNGLFRFDRQSRRFVCVLGPDCSDPKRRFSLYMSRGCVDSDGILWIGTFGQGLLRVDPDTEQVTFFRTPEPKNWVTCVQEGRDETGRRLLWIGDERGLLAFRPEQQQFYRLPGLPGNPLYVHTIYRDTTSGLLWVGTSDGLLKYNPQDNLIQTTSLPPTLVHQPVTINVITADRLDTTGQTYWLGLSHTGLLRWHRPTNQFRLIRYPSHRAETMWIEQPGDGRLWVGLRRWDYEGDGVLVYNTRQHRFVTTLAAKRAGTLFSVPFVDHGLIDTRQRLWVGNNDEGLRVLDIHTGQQLHYWADSVITNLHRNNNFLTDIKLDQQDRIWLGTYQGLYYVDETTHQFVRADDRHTNRQLNDELATNRLLVSPRTGHIWAARWGSVTESRSDGKLLTVLTARNGLFDRENRQLAEDQTGTIWIGNVEGLHAYTSRTHRLFRLTTSEGLSRNNTTGGLYMHQGVGLFIGQQNGLNYVDIRALNQPVQVPPVVINSFRVHEQERSVDLSRPVQLTRSDNAFSIDFSCLTYNRVPTIRYAYFLDGLDTRWNYSGVNHRAYYTNLSPGTYTLYLKAANTFGNWTRQPVKLTITVLPAVYETWWFKALLALAVSGGLYGLYRYRVDQLLRVQRIRNRISADLHDEIGSSLSGIGILGAMAQQTLPVEHPSGPLVGRIISEARMLSSSLDDIVWSINPRNDEFSSLLARMNRYAAELFEATGITYDIIIPELVNDVLLPMEKRRDFYLIFKESVNNLVKHSQATQARLTISLTNNWVRLEVSDNGRGFDAAAETDRNGIRNMYARSQHLRGRLSIRTAPGQGTHFVLEFPMAI